MTTHVSPLRPFALTLALGILAACGDDADDADSNAGSTSEADDETSSSTGPEASTSLDPAGPSTAAESSTGGDDPFAGCSRETLAADFGVVDAMGVPGPPRWYGPGADPETGELLDDGETTYVVSVTYLALQADAFPAFSELNPALNAALFANPGLVATQLGASLQCNAARTFTVWRDEAAMMAFVTSDAHLAAIGAFPSLSRGSSTLSVWAEPVPAAEITWEAALSRIATAEAYD